MTTGSGKGLGRYDMADYRVRRSRQCRSVANSTRLLALSGPGTSGIDAKYTCYIEAALGLASLPLEPLELRKSGDINSYRAPDETASVRLVAVRRCICSYGTSDVGD